MTVTFVGGWVSGKLMDLQVGKTYSLDSEGNIFDIQSGEKLVNINPIEAIKHFTVGEIN